MHKILFQLDTDPIANTFDTVVGYDGGADRVHAIGGVTPENVGALVDGAIFTRSPKHKKNTALFVTGSDMGAGAEVYRAVCQHFFNGFRVSVMLDSNGSNTTAAAAVASIAKRVSLTGKRAVVLAGTGPVGQRAAVILARQGAEVVLTSRRLERAQAACEAMNAQFSVGLQAAVAADDATTGDILDNAHIVLTTGAAGTQLIGEAQWRDHATLQVLLDANATPPAGIGGIDLMDKGAERYGKITFGAIGFGALKLEVHRTCVGRLFERNDQTFDAEEVFEVACELA